MKDFKPSGLPLLIGSLPVDDHETALELVMAHTPQIPLWVQLPCYPEEGMIPQFLEGLPGVDLSLNKNLINTDKEGFDEEIVSFFEDYLSLSEPGADLENSRFALNGNRAKGFRKFLKQIDAADDKPFALKGQVTGPISFCTSVKDQSNKDIFYNDQLKDAAVKKLALNARWQANAFEKRGALPIIFIDEPALAGFGTSAYLTITKDDVLSCLDEIVQEIHSANGLAGVHVCGNTQWDMLLGASIDIISFDAFSYFDRFILYPEALKLFLGQGKILAWGIVPTSEAQIVQQQTAQGLSQMLNRQIDELAQKTGFDKETIISQSLVTPSCGTGPLDRESAKKVLELTQTISQIIRAA